MRIVDVRDQMPNFEHYRCNFRSGDILGIALHHSATAHPQTGLGKETAANLFAFHVFERGWDHGGYHYVVHANGLVEYALDERIAAYHAGFSDPGDQLGLDSGQYWNRHYLSICMVGYFQSNRVVTFGSSQPLAMPDFFTRPTAVQYGAVFQLIQRLRSRYNIDVEQVRGHRELTGCNTQCPGKNVDLDDLRSGLRRAE